MSHDDIGMYSDLADRVTTGGIEFGRCEPEANAGRTEGENTLHRSFTIRSLTDDRATAAITDGTGKDLACARAVAVNEDNQRNAPSPFAMGCVIEILQRIAAAGRHDAALGNELVSHFDRRR